jgi:hypothetical protein
MENLLYEFGVVGSYFIMAMIVALVERVLALASVRSFMAYIGEQVFFLTHQ